MKTKTTLEIDDRDLNHIFNLAGTFYRMDNSDEYEKTIPHLRAACGQLAQRAFEIGREFERKNGDE